MKQHRLFLERIEGEFDTQAFTKEKSKRGENTTIGKDFKLISKQTCPRK